jgi:hypothetical protein
MLSRRSSSTASRSPRRAGWRPSARAAAILVLIASALVLSPRVASADLGDTAVGSGTISPDTWHCAEGSVGSLEIAATGTDVTSATGTFSFSCGMSPRGYPAITFSGTVDCLREQSSTTSILGGTVTQTNEPVFPVGQELHFALKDGGVGSDDGISDLYEGSSCGDNMSANVPVAGEITLYRSPQCSDGRDNDGDGFTDYPADPGCTSAADDTESPNPPPPAQCADGTDNDDDGFTDYPADPGCTSATDDTESPNPTNGLSCDGRTATVYVANGRIVGGPDSGLLFTGTLRGTAGADVISGSTRADTIHAGGGADVVCALGGNDAVSGEGDADKLIGGAGNDTMSGGTGADTLQGRGGNDTLTGGEGADRFVGGPGTDTAIDYNRAQGDTRVSIP